MDASLPPHRRASSLATPAVRLAPPPRLAQSRPEQPPGQRRTAMSVIDIPTTDLFPPELVRLSATASEVLDTHLSEGGCCVVCRSVWPCEQAQLAEHNLAAL